LYSSKSVAIPDANRDGSPSLLGTAEFLVPTGSFFHAQTPVSFHMREELSPNVRMILYQYSVYIQRQLPVEEEPLLAQKHWEFLYARSIGCIGLLKLHLNRALNKALREGACTVTENHLHQTAAPDARIKLALRDALESEAEFVEAKNADEQLLALLRKSAPSLSSSAKQQSLQGEQEQIPSPRIPKNQKPGKRAPGRDATGSEVRYEQRDGEQAAG
jgi:hypothetical protein